MVMGSDYYESDAQREARLPGVRSALVVVEQAGGLIPRPGGLEGRRPLPGREKADEAGAEDHQRKRGREEEDRDKGRRRDQPQRRAAQRARRQPPHRLQHHRQHARFQPEEQRRQRPDMAIERVEDAERQHAKRARQDEQPARHQRPGGAVHQPADIGGQLHRLRARQQHAEVQRMLKPPLADPAMLHHGQPVHDADLRRRAAEAQQGDAQPDPRGVGERLARPHATRRGAPALHPSPSRRAISTVRCAKGKTSCARRR